MIMEAGKYETPQAGAEEPIFHSSLKKPLWGAFFRVSVPKCLFLIYTHTLILHLENSVYLFISFSDFFVGNIRFSV